MSEPAAASSAAAPGALARFAELLGSLGLATDVAAALLRRAGGGWRFVDARPYSYAAPPAA